MMTTKNIQVQFPLFGILGLIFITLKLMGTITWSWIWVLSPFWIPFVLVIAFVSIAALVLSIKR